MRAIAIFLVKILSRIIYRVKIIGEENIPEKGPAIICPNHVHALDSAVLVSNIKRKINILAKEELLKNKFIKWFANKCAVYPIKRNSADIQAIKLSLKLLKNDELLLIFIEGTRNGIEKGEEVKNGAVVMAMKSKVPIIPVGIQGDFKPFKKVVLTFGTPIIYDEYKDKISDKQYISKLTTELMDNILKLTNV